MVFGPHFSLGGVCPSSRCCYPTPALWQILQGRRSVLYKYSFQGLVTANIQDFLFWMSTLNFARALGCLRVSSEPVFTGIHMHTCTYAMPIDRKEHSV